MVVMLVATMDLMMESLTVADWVDVKAVMMDFEMVEMKEMPWVG
jgi:hypothetical protein